VRILGEEGALRSRLVHGYDGVDDQRVRDFLGSAAATLKAFVKTIGGPKRASANGRVGRPG
jgi:uncharacterized protein YutE (UPF0331/DUF86 family)